MRASASRCAPSMKAIRYAVGCGLLSVVSVAVAAGQVGESTGLLSNATFSEDRNADMWPDGWPGGPGLTWHRKDAPELSFIRLQPPEPGKSVMLYRDIRIPPGAAALSFLIKARAVDVVAGDQPWHDARFVMEFRDASGAKTGPAPAPLIVSRGGSREWRVFSGRLAVPTGATNLSVLAAMFNCRSGSLDLGLMEISAETD